MARTPTPPADDAPNDAPEGPFGIPVEAFITDDRVRIEVAGLLASKPELRVAHLERDVWQSELDAYLTSERP